MGYDIRRQLMAEEGSIPHAYQDHLGYWTIGVGRLIDKRKGGGLRPDEIQYLLSNDIRRCVMDLVATFPWFNRLNEPRRAVLIGMCFQMGFEGLMKFHATLARIEEGNYESAAANMKRSLWARQTPERAARMAEQMRTGQWQKKPGFE